MGIPEGEDKEKETKTLKARSENFLKLEGDSHTDSQAQRTPNRLNMSR